MYDLNRYYGDNKPSWEPNVLALDKSDMFVKEHRLNINNFKYPVFIADKVFSKSFCDSLIDQFNDQPQYPVGIDGYVNAEDKAGSYRSMGWSPELAYKISEKLRDIMHQNLVIMSSIAPDSWPNRLLMPFKKHGKTYTQLGSTPWLRFMKYKNGGMHTPHHDAPFENELEKYITLFSWVLYLNTPEGKGGEFQFVNDTRNTSYWPNEWDRSDWTEMSNDIKLSIIPEQGRMLVFPHWLCHQVQQYVGEGYRYIIRGDVSYAY